MVLDFTNEIIVNKGPEIEIKFVRQMIMALTLCNINNNLEIKCLDDWLRIQEIRLRGENAEKN